ncbi:MAG: flagellar hook-length control protein FliK [Rhodocyclaceae bacterium]|nr:flagellar hook-length control protein FliK [Rhodocyclaceae bacterium]
MSEINAVVTPAATLVAPPSSSPESAGNADGQPADPFAAVLQKATQQAQTNDAEASEATATGNPAHTDAGIIAGNAELASILPMLMAVAQATSAAESRGLPASDAPAVAADSPIVSAGETAPPLIAAPVSPDVRIAAEALPVADRATSRMRASAPATDSSSAAIRAAVLAALPAKGEERLPGDVARAVLSEKAEAGLPVDIARAALSAPAETMERLPGDVARAVLLSKTERSPSADVVLVEATGNFEDILSAARETQAGMTPGAARVAHEAIRALPVETPVGTRGWDADVGNRLVWMASRQESRADLVLNPPQMGRIEVSLSISGGEASAQFVSASPTVREALENAMPRLRELLADAGITLGQAQVGSQSAGNRENGDNSPRTPPDSLAAGGDAGPARGFAGAPAHAWQRAGRGLVDVFA